ncbi:hypothetical protein FAIPA1_60019 [Frankia sp. AiPs1]
MDGSFAVDVLSAVAGSIAVVVSVLSGVGSLTPRVVGRGMSPPTPRY